MLAGSLDGLFLGFAADGAGVGNLAVLAAGSILTAGLDPLVVSSHGLVAQRSAADGALVLGNTGGRAGGSLQNGIHNDIVGIGIHGSFSIRVSIATDRAGMGGVALILTGRCSHNALILMTLSGLCQIALEGLYSDVAAHGAGVLHTGSVGAVSLNQLAVVPLVTQSLSSLGLGVVAARALEGIQTGFLAGSSLVSLIGLIQNQIMAQRFAALNDSGIALGAADGADLTDHGRLGAGCYNRVINVGMLAGSLDRLFLGFAAYGAGVGNLAVLTASGLHTASLRPIVVSRHGLVAQRNAADITDIFADTGLGTGGRLQNNANHRNMGIRNNGSLRILVALAANRAGMGGEALILTGRSRHNSLILVTQSGRSQSLLGKLIHIHRTADSAGVLHSSAKITAGIHDLTLVPGMPKGIRRIGKRGLIAAGALQGVVTAHSAGSRSVAGKGLIQLHIVTQRITNSLAGHFRATVRTGDNHRVTCRTGRILHSIFRTDMLAWRFLCRKRGDRKHGEYHNQHCEECQ